MWASLLILSYEEDQVNVRIKVCCMNVHINVSLTGKWLSRWSACHINRRSWVLAPHPPKKPDTVVQDYSPSIGEAKAGGSLDIAGQDCWSKSVPPGSVRDPVSKKQGGQWMRRTLNTNTLAHTRTHTYKYIETCNTQIILTECIQKECPLNI